MMNALGLIDHTHAADAVSWVPDANKHGDFPVQNLPFAIFSPDIVGVSHDTEARAACAIGDYIVDLAGLVRAQLLPSDLKPALTANQLNSLFALPREKIVALRHSLFALLTDPRQRDRIEPHLHRAADCRLHLPFVIGDYTDFYTGIHHATNIGKLFRPDNPLLANYKHVPIAYHGRASSVRVSGTDVHRPKGQIKPPDKTQPIFTASRRLDYELELGIWIAGDHALGNTIPIAKAWERIGGFCLLNDWSARDIQAWEYQPLGPFLAKNFLTSVSPWVVTAEALAPFRIASRPRPQGDPELLAYLDDANDRNNGALALTLEATLASAAMREAKLTPYQLSLGDACNAMYWTPAQMIAHHASNGCDLHTGDLLGTGTLSGTNEGSFGSLMEISHNGLAPITLPNGEIRSFLEDNDMLMISAKAKSSGFKTIGFGPCYGIIKNMVDDS